MEIFENRKIYISKHISNFCTLTDGYTFCSLDDLAKAMVFQGKYFPEDALQLRFLKIVFGLHPRYNSKLWR